MAKYHPNLNSGWNHIALETKHYRSVLLELPTTPRHRSFQEVARECTRRVHEGERFKQKRVIGPYAKHPEWVASRMHTEQEVVTALLHDVIETELKNRLVHMKRNPQQPKLFESEEQAIGQIKAELATYFRRRGHDITPYLPDLDALTKRQNEKHDYRGYIGRIVAYAHSTKRKVPVKIKLADLEHNSQEDRNPKGGNLTQKDMQRLADYDWAISRFKEEFPDVRLKDEPLSRPKRLAREEKEHNGHARRHRKWPTRKGAKIAIKNYD